MEQKEMKEKNEVYKRKSSPTLKRNLAISVVLCIYLFLFSSSLILPTPITEKGLVTTLGQEAEFAENRTVTLVSANYDKDKEVMELVLNLTNNNFDGINDYYYALESEKGVKDIEIKEIFHEELITVIRLLNVPSNYAEITFYFAPKYTSLDNVTDEMTGIFILNKYNVASKSIDLDKTKTDYFKERLEGIIEGYRKKIDGINKKIEGLEKQAKALNDENKELNKQELYMTDAEITEKKSVIMANNAEVVKIKQQIKSYEATVRSINEAIADAEEKLKGF